MLEHCCECDTPTGRAGRGEDSIYIAYPDHEVGPLCEYCRDFRWVCEKCGQGVENEYVTIKHRHIGCGGECT